MSVDEPPSSPCQSYPDGAGACPLCGGDIGEVERIGHWRESQGGGGYWYAGRCGSCDVDFRMRHPGRPTGFQDLPVWHVKAPEPEWLGDPLLPAELHELGVKVGHESGVREAWLGFIQRARVRDEYHWYSFPEAADLELPAPVARVRGGVPVAWFSPIDNLRFLEAPQARAREAEHAAHERARLAKRLQRARDRARRPQ